MIRIVPKTPGVDELGTAAKQWAVVRAVSILINGVAAARVTRPIDQFGEPSDNTDLDASPSRHGLMSKADKVKLNGIAAGAQVNPTAPAIVTAYASEVPQVSSGEKANPLATPAIRRSSPADIAGIADARISALGVLDGAAAVSAVAAATANSDTVSKTFDAGVISYSARRKTTALGPGQGALGADSGGLYVDLGTTAATACAGNDARLPTADQKAALSLADAPTSGNPLQTLSGAKSIPLDEFAVPGLGTALDATTTRHGLMSAVDKTKLDGINPSATGDMLAATYDPTAKAADAFSMANMVETAGAKIMTDAERTKLAGVSAGANAYTLPVATSSVIGGVKRNEGAEGQFVNGISAAGDLEFGTPGALGTIVLHDQKVNGAHGGASTAATWNHRNLNQKVLDTGNHCTLASNAFTLDPGVYEIAARAPGRNVEAQRLRLWNVTTGAAVAGLTAPNSAAIEANDQNEAELSGRFTVAAGGETFRIDHYTTSGIAVSGLGTANAISGLVEIYTTVTLRKLS